MHHAPKRQPRHWFAGSLVYKNAIDFHLTLKHVDFVMAMAIGCKIAHGLPWNPSNAEIVIGTVDTVAGIHRFTPFFTLLGSSKNIKSTEADLSCRCKKQGSGGMEIRKFLITFGIDRGTQVLWGRPGIPLLFTEIKIRTAKSARNIRGKDEGHSILRNGWMTTAVIVAVEGHRFNVSPFAFDVFCDIDAELAMMNRRLAFLIIHILAACKVQFGLIAVQAGRAFMKPSIDLPLRRSTLMPDFDFGFRSA
jgi:hypothetical protein